MFNRRTFLKNTLGTGAIALATGAGLLVPTASIAAWNKASFNAKNLGSAMKNAGDTSATASDKINIKAPDIAENGSVVPVTISSSLSGVDRINIYVEKNGTPLTAAFKLDASTEAFVSTRVKMGKTSNIVAVVHAGGKTYTAQKEVKVTIGGCGG